MAPSSAARAAVRSDHDSLRSQDRTVASAALTSLANELWLPERSLLTTVFNPSSDDLADVHRSLIVRNSLATSSSVHLPAQLQPGFQDSSADRSALDHRSGVDPSRRQAARRRRRGERPGGPLDPAEDVEAHAAGTGERSRDAGRPVRGRRSRSGDRAPPAAVDPVRSPGNARASPPPRCRRWADTVRGYLRAPGPPGGTPAARRAGGAARPPTASTRHRGAPPARWRCR